ncbi:WASF1 [Cordylochernes scorpioides]|uniref:WASF1 n=1 Tax=Cordylochernes scorpioides TaxID=51811 RepID=A0ABY6LDU4_9ARAC|nr:WASF1 [Cordylochernes scorpioides]
MRKAFKSSVIFDQQVVARSSLPAAMRDIYTQCDKPPPLDKLNPYREDGKDGLKFYTDPNYFFDLWRQEMQKETERIMHDRGKKVRELIIYFLKHFHLASFHLYSFLFILANLSFRGFLHLTLHCTNDKAQFRL